MPRIGTPGRTARNFKWHAIPAKTWHWPTRDRWLFALRVMAQMRRFRPDAIYSRSYVFPYVSSRFGIPTIVETHAPPTAKNPDLNRLAANGWRKALKT